MTRAAALVLALLGLVPRAAGQSSTGELGDAPPRHRIALELGFFYRREGETDLAMLQPSVYATLVAADVQPGVALDVDFAWRGVGLFGDYGAFRAMNPYFGVRLGESGENPIAGTRWRARGGLGGTLPLTNAYRDAPPALPTPSGGYDGYLAQLYVAGMQGDYDPWLEAPLTTAIAVRGDVEHRAPSYLLGGDLALAVLFAVPYEDDGGTRAALEIGFFSGGRVLPELTVGVRAQGVLLVGSRAGGTFSLVPFVRAELGQGFVELRLLMNLLGPWAVSFEPGLNRIWAIQLHAGVRFE